MPKVFVEPIGITLTVDEQENLLEGLVRAQIDIPTDCAGRGTCGKCLVRLGSGDLTAPTERELKRIPEKLRAEGWRLACQAYPRSARVSIEVRGTAGQRRILTTSKLTHGAAHPAVCSRSVQLEPPTLADKRSDLERLDEGLGGVEVPLHVLEELPATLRDGKWKVTATLYGKRVIDVHPGERERECYGVAVDIGTSKVIAYLFDLRHGTMIDQEAIENPQMRYGEDVISRIAHAAQNHETAELAAAVRGGINANLAALYERQDVHPNHVCDMTVVGNTAMHHLALGLSPVGLGQAPFAPAAAEPLTLRASELGIDMNPDGGVHFPPPIAGFVGSDALAVVAATHLAGKKRPSMAIDIGTNTEIALAHDGRVTVTSCASGPAFEGYQIRNGMKAVAGAIERVKIDAAGEATEHRHHHRSRAHRHLRLGRRRPARRARPRRRRRQERAHAGRPPAGAQGRRGRRVPAHHRPARRHRLHPARRAQPAARQGRHPFRLGAADGRAWTSRWRSSTPCTSRVRSATTSTWPRRSTSACSRRSPPGASRSSATPPASAPRWPSSTSGRDAGWPACATASSSWTSPRTSAFWMSSPVASASPAIERRSAVNEGGAVGAPLSERRSATSEVRA